MKINKLILSLVIVVQAFGQKNDQPSALELVEQVAENDKINQKDIEDYEVSIQKKQQTKENGWWFEVVKHSKIDVQELKELNAQIDLITNEANSNEYTYQKDYEFQIEGGKFELQDYQHTNLTEVNYEQELAQLLKESLDGKLFNLYFFGIRFNKETDLKNEICSVNDQTHLRFLLDDYLGDYTGLRVNSFSKLPKFLRKTKRYVYSYDEDAELEDGFLKIKIESVKSKNKYKDGFFIVDAETKSLVEVYLEKQHKDINGCSTSSAHIMYKKQVEAMYLPEKISIKSCKNCDYKDKKIKIKAVKPATKETLKYRQGGSCESIKEVEVKIDYRSQEVDVVN